MPKQNLLTLILNSNSIKNHLNLTNVSLGSKIIGNSYKFSTNNKNTKGYQYSQEEYQQLEGSKKKSSQSNRKSFLGGGKVDSITEKTLVQYERKMKQIRDQHNLLQQQTHLKYKLLSQRLSKNNKNLTEEQQQQIQDQEQQIKVQRMNQLLENQSKFKLKIQQLVSDYSRNIQLSRKQYQLQYIKNYMLKNVQQFKKQPQKQSLKQSTQTKGMLLQQLLASTTKYQKQSSYIPNNLVLKKLYFTHDNNKQSAVLLAGIEQSDQDHSAYLKTLIQRLKIKHVLAMLAPDLPYFIKTETSFLSQWQQFLKIPSPTVKFYLNPNPKTLNDITLASTHIPLVLHGMTRSKSFYQTTFSLMQMNEATFKYHHQPLFSGLLAGMVQNVYFCDYPFLKQRQMIAMSVELDDLRQLMKRYAYYKQNEKQNFSAQLLLPKAVVEKKYRHMIKLAKTIALTKQSTPILICPASIAEVLAQQWQKSPPQYLQFDYTQNSYLLDMELNKQGQKQALFIEFIEKLVILDIILQPLINRYFVKYGSFPYSCRNTIGGKQNLTKVFLLWKHYYTLYQNAAKGKFSNQKDKWQVPI